MTKTFVRRLQKFKQDRTKRTSGFIVYFIGQLEIWDKKCQNISNNMNPSKGENGKCMCEIDNIVLENKKIHY
jgi:hypothetical protein